MTFFDIIAIVLTITALASYVNHRYLKMPNVIGLMSMSLVLSVLAIAGEHLGWLDLQPLREFVKLLDFSNILLHGMLSFLLFAGALHINLADLKTSRWSILLLATAGVALSMFLVGGTVWYIAQLCGIALPFIHALLFGALISPTDPIAVLGILKDAKAPERLFTKIAGESLFNDGIGVVAFITVLTVTMSDHPFTAGDVGILLVQEVIGGAALGLLLGGLTFWLLRGIDAYKVEVLLTLALVAGGYALAESLHVSAPICMVVVGLIIGNHGRGQSMSDETRDRLDQFWELLDEILNAVLFLMMGLEIVLLKMHGDYFLLGVACIVLVLVSRFVSVSIPIRLLALKQSFDEGTIKLLTWGGLRGGLSIAMALSLPHGPEKDLILILTYVVVVFSIMVQGTTFKALVRTTLPSNRDQDK